MRRKNSVFWVTAMLVVAVALPVQAEDNVEAKSGVSLPCVCPFYYYGPSGYGTYYHYAYTHDPDCATSIFTFDEFPAPNMYGYCDTQCQLDCQPLYMLKGSPSESGSATACCGAPQEQKTAAREEKSKQKQPTLPEFFGVTLPVKADFTHKDLKAKPLPENQRERPVGDPILVKYCTDEDCSTPKYILILRFEKTVTIDGIVNFHPYAIAFESEPPAKDVPQLRAALRQVTTQNGQASNLLLGKYGVTPFILLIREGTIGEWVDDSK